MNLEIGAKIKQLRLARGMTQEQLGKPLRLSAQAVSKWESGATMPDIQLLPELSVQLGVTIDELFSMTDRTRMDRIDNMLEDVRYLPAHEFENIEQYLKDKITLPDTKAEATLLLARLYNKRAGEYRELATPLPGRPSCSIPTRRRRTRPIWRLPNVPCRIGMWQIAGSSLHFTRNLYANIRIPGPIICGLWICSWRTDARQKLGMPWRPWAAWSAPITMTSMTV